MVRGLTLTKIKDSTEKREFQNKKRMRTQRDGIKMRELLDHENHMHIMMGKGARYDASHGERNFKWKRIKEN